MTYSLFIYLGKLNKINTEISVTHSFNKTLFNILNLCHRQVLFSLQDKEVQSRTDEYYTSFTLRMLGM